MDAEVNTAEQTIAESGNPVSAGEPHTGDQAASVETWREVEMDPTVDDGQPVEANPSRGAAPAAPESNADGESAAQADETASASQDGSSGQEDGQAEELEGKALADTLIVDPEAQVNEALLKTAFALHPKFEERWKGSSKGLKGGPQSWDYSLCYYMLYAGWQPQQIVDGLVAQRRLYRKDPPGIAKYYAKVIADTRPRVARNKERAEKRKQEEQSGDGSQSKGSDKTDSESRAAAMFGQLRKSIDQKNGQFLRDADGDYHLVLEGRRIHLVEGPKNYRLAGLMLETCDSSTLPPSARSAIQRLQVHAANATGQMRLEKFSALSSDGKRLYVPIASGKLLQISAEGITEVPNGKNEDSVWVEHPGKNPDDQSSGKPLQFSDADPKTGLELFEKYVVDTQACAQEEMKLFVAMAEGLYPYIRAVCLNRLIVVHVGAGQQGKTSGAQRFTRLHGLGAVKGDYSVAALAALGDNGLLALDNKEQANLTNSLIDFLLFLATGAVRGRSTADGRLRESRSGRPVGVVTSIEGMFRDELQKRCIEVEYKVVGGMKKRAPIERDIDKHRDEIGSAHMHVLRRYMAIAAEDRETPNPIPAFEEHFSALCNLLRAYGEVGGKPEGWAEDIIGRWAEILSQREPDENELEQPLIRVIDVAAAGELPEPSVVLDITHDDKEGRLLVTNGTTLRTGLQGLWLRDLVLPKTAQGLTRRLRSSHFVSIAVLHDENAPEIPELRRRAGQRAIGIFQPYPEPDE